MCGGFWGGCVGGEVVGFVLVIRELWVGGLEISMGIFSGRPAVGPSSGFFSGARL